MELEAAVVVEAVLAVEGMIGQPFRRDGEDGEERLRWLCLNVTVLMALGAQPNTSFLCTCIYMYIVYMHINVYALRWRRMRGCTLS